MNPLLFPALGTVQGELLGPWAWWEHGGDLHGSKGELPAAFSACQLRCQVNRDLSCGGADLAVQLLQYRGGQMLTLRTYPEMLLVLFLPLFAEASLFRRAS